MESIQLIRYLLLFIFVVGYLAIIFEFYIKVNKTASSLIMAVLTWGVLFSYGDTAFATDEVICEQLGHASSVIFFLLAAVTLVELIDSHQGFKIITDFINTRSKKKMLWVVGIISFFVSSVLDNLTTTVVLVSVLRKIIPDRNDRLFLGSVIVIGANAGGAWTPIGDVTTTMLWIKGNISSIAIMKTLFLPSLFSLIVSLLLITYEMRGKYPDIVEAKVSKTEPGAKAVFFIGILSLISVPIIKAITGLPPFMSILLGLGTIWLITDLMHHKFDERKHLRVPYVLTKIDSAGILFFLGILLCIGSLEMVGILKSFALFLDKHIANTAAVATTIGLLSAVVDNVPLVAACTGMYSLQTHPPDSPFWHMIAYTAGTGGSILIIGSAAGVALMGLEKVDFIWYVKKISLTALAGYLAGIALYLLLNMF